MRYVLLGLILIWAVWMPLRFFWEKKGKKALSLVFKAAGTLTAVAFAVWAVVWGAPGQVYARWMLVGLLLCTCADVLLAIKFEVGGLLFFLGHVAYVSTFIHTMGLSPASLVVFIAVMALLLWYLGKFRTRLSPGKWTALHVYAPALAALMAASAPLPFQSLCPQTLLAALGAALFVASDMTLLRNRVEKRGIPARYASLGLYYTGQLALALSAAVL